MNKLIGLYSPAAQSGKSFTANVLAQQGYVSMSFAEPIKRMGTEFLMSFGYEKDQAAKLVWVDKEKFVPEIGCSARFILQTLGTEWGRERISSTIWIDSMRSRIQKAMRKDSCGVVIDDVRFENEAEMIKQMGGEMWKVIRTSTINKSTHASEGGLDHWAGFDRVIISDGTIQDFRNKIDEIIRDAQGQKR